jgi:hypothetical protein
MAVNCIAVHAMALYGIILHYMALYGYSIKHYISLYCIIALYIFVSILW